MADDRFKYKIIGIYHSGRKGLRGEPRTDPKYEGMIGTLCDFDPEEVKMYQEVRFHLKDHPMYEWWHTTGAVGLARNFDGSYHFETVNTIYVFKEVNE